MAINLAEKYSSLVDERFTKQSLITPAVNKDYDWEGVATVKVYSVNTVAEGDYSRTGTSRYGTPTDLQDAVQSMKVEQDKSFTFVIDKGDALSQVGIKNAGTALSRQLNEVTIPNRDKYVLGVMAAAVETPATGAITKANAYEAFLAGTEALNDALVPLTGRIAFVTSKFYTKIKLDSSFIKQSELGQQVAYNGQVGMIDGVAVILTPSSYLPANAEFLITHPIATTAAEKIAEYKVHQDPVGISGNLVEGRTLYDAFVRENKKAAIYFHKSA